MQFELLPPVPAVVSVRLLRRIPLFSFASVDELFRFSGIARQVRHKQGGYLQKEGAPAEYIQVLVEGKVWVSGTQRSDEEIDPPRLFGFREVLEGMPLRETARAQQASICLAMGAEDFRTLISDNVELAAGLFRMLLGEQAKGSSDSILRQAVTVRPPSTRVAEAMNNGFKALGHIDKALLLQELPVFTRATTEGLSKLVSITRETDLAPDSSLFTEGDPPSIWLLLSGEIAMTAQQGEPLVARAGDALGMNETLAGRPWGRRGEVKSQGKALRIEREALFDLLADNVDLLQGLFAALFRSKELVVEWNR